MLAAATLPKQYSAWNRRWHAPFGRSVPFRGSLAWSRPVLLYRGPFTFSAQTTLQGAIDIIGQVESEPLATVAGGLLR